MSFKRIILLLVAAVSAAAYAQTLTCTNPKIVFSEDFTFFSNKESTSLDNFQNGKIETSYIKDNFGASDGNNVTDGHCLVVTSGSEGGFWGSEGEPRQGNTGNAGASVKDGFPAKDGFLLVNCDVNNGDLFAYTLPSGSLCPGINYNFSADITNMNNPGYKVRTPVNVSFIVLGLPGNVELLNVSTGDISETGLWFNMGGTFASGQYTDFRLILRNNYKAPAGTQYIPGNDVGIDNIVFSACTPEIKIHSDYSNTNDDIELCEQQTNIYFNDADLRQYYTQPYFILQQSTDVTTWKNINTATTTPQAVIDMSIQTNGTPYYYRAWCGGDTQSVTDASNSGIGNCSNHTVVSEPIKITRSCSTPSVLTCTNPKVVFSEDFTFFSKDSCTALSNILGGQIHTDYDIDDPPADRTWTHYVIDGHCLVVNTAGAGGWWINNKPVRKGNTGNEGASIKGGQPERDGYLLVNCADELGDMFSYTLPDQQFCPNTYYNFTADITNLGNDPASTAVPVNVSFIVMGLPGEVELLNVSSGDIKETSQWINVGGSFNAGNFTSFRLIIRNNIRTHNFAGNDAGIDNIVFSGCIPDTKVTSGDADKDGKISKCATETTITFNDTDLRQYFTQPYYQLQMSTDCSSWQNVGDVTTTPTATIDMDSQTNKTPYYYRVWSGSNEASVTQSAATGQAGSCTDMTVVSKVMTIIRDCDYTKSEAPVVDEFTECAGTTPSGKLDLTTLVTEHKEKLTWYKAASGDEKMESATVDISQPGVYHYYVTNTEPGYTKLESDRTEVTVTIKGHIQYSLDKTQISECLQYENERSFNIQNPVPTDASFEWYSGSTLLGTGLKYTLENVEGSGTITIKATDASGNFCATPDKQVKYNLSNPVSAELKASPLAVYIGKTEVTVTASNVEGSGKYTLYKGENEVLSGTSQEGKDITFTDKDFTTEGFLTYKIVLTNGLCSAEDYATVDVIRGGGEEPEPIVTRVIEPMLFFTPNGDGLNDNWVVKNIEGYGYYVVEIYDRYGKCLVKATDSYKPFMWNGIYNGHEMPNDDYWFIITIQEGDVRKQRSGHFRLRR